MTRHTYKSAGVDLEAARRVKDRIRDIVTPTHGPQVLGGLGGFGGLFHLTGYRDPVLVASTDGVGTKLKVASLVGRYDTIGQDLVALCVNDVVVCGARPLFFLDYVALGDLARTVVEDLVAGMARTCADVGCALIGGETAQLPGLYAPGDFDLAGFVVGCVERDRIIDGSAVREGDLIVGLPSSGLHTNGFSLVRRVFAVDQNPAVLERTYPELGRSLGEELLEPHRPYWPRVAAVLDCVTAMAHITGGGLVENVPRVLPQGMAARFQRGTWTVPPIFTLIQEVGGVEEAEMYRVFNMGLGMVLLCHPDQATRVLSRLPGSAVVGRVEAARGPERVILD